MKPKFKCGDRVKILPHPTYDAIVGGFGEIVGVGPDFGLMGPTYIVLFNKNISDDYQWKACIVLEQYLEQPY